MIYKVKPLHLKKPSNRSFQHKGFALIAVLLLLALATILVVTSSMLGQIERRTAANSANIEKARQNALFGLNAALGQLQVVAGPDQRITSRADIISGATNLYWTGVWKTGTNTLDGGATPQRQLSLGSTTPNAQQIATNAVWLVSGATNSATINPLSTASTNSVLLAKNLGTVGDNVSVPLVTMQTNSTSATTMGKYAYWISDEGVKAKANLVNTNLNLSPSSKLVESQLQFLAPSANAAHKVLPGNLSVDFRTNTFLPRVLTLDALKQIPSTSSSFSMSTNAPDLTVHSYGVLADVKNGGLKKDLTAAFEDDSLNNATGAMQSLIGFSNTLKGYAGSPDSGKVYAITPIGGSYFTTYAQGYSVSGLRWLSLYNYYNQYKAIPSVPKTYALNGNPKPGGVGAPAAKPSVTVRNYNSDANYEGGGAVNANKLIRDNLCAKIIAWQMHIGVKSYQDPSDLRWKLKILLMPALVLYNPYNVKLSHPANFQYQFTGWYNLNSGFDVLRLCVGNNGVNANRFNLNPLQNLSLAAQGAQGDVSPAFATRAGEDLNLEPGEIRIFGLNARVEPASGPNNFASLRNFFSPDFYHAVDLGKVPVSVFGNSTPPGQNPPPTPPTTGAFGYNVFTKPLIPTNDVRTPANTFFIGTASGADNVYVLGTFGRIRTNDGRFNVGYAIANSSPPGGTWPLWPQGGNVTGQYLGHMFLQDITLTPLASPLNLGPISSLTQPVKFLTYTVWMKGSNSSQDLAGSGTITAQPMPVFSSAGTFLNPTGYSIANATIDLQNEVGVFQMDKASLNATPDASGFIRSYWGNAVTGGETQIALKEVPRQPLVSLGQFMHMNASYDPNRSGSALRSTELYPVGGSWASAFIYRDQAFLNNDASHPATISMATGSGEGSGAVENQDDNYLANDALFDTYFLSTVPSAYQVANNTLYPPRNQTFDAAYILADKPLPNSRHRYYRKNGVNPLVNDLRDFNKASANLLVDGAFNVNSTSVNAWAALLSSLSGNQLLATDGTVVDTSGGSPIPRLLCPVAGGTTSVNTPWGGVRVLTDAEIQNLATQIVSQIKARGPFLSMADFLNRRLIPTASDTNNFGLYGALQAAIENSTVNSATKAAVGHPTVVIPGNLGIGNYGLVYFDANNLPANSAVGTPGYLMQQDIIQAFAPVMTVRSDTFLVRCYGEALNIRTGVTEGKAWGEAVVQRVPDYVDDTVDLPQTSLASLTSAANKTYGRRMKIVSFRWLNENEL